MKDLFIYVADADAMAFMKSILSRPQAIGIRTISFDIDRHPLRDSGMIQSGPELVCMKKGSYSKVILMWDHHGSGREKKKPQEVKKEIQSKLDLYTWKDNSFTMVLVPELEQWLWYCESALLSHYKEHGLTKNLLTNIVNKLAGERGKTATELKRDEPKELFESIIKVKLRRTISPRDFEQIGEHASITSLCRCDSFKAIVDNLRNWFPLYPTE